jgi:site-specific DNA recombinase
LNMKSFSKKKIRKTAVIYTRVSTDEQAEQGFSLPHQEDTLRKECARQGIQVIEHFEDDGFSAKDFKRPNFRRLISYLQRHKKQVDYLFVTKWCRFSRNVENSIMMCRELQQYGTEVKSIDFQDDSDNPESLLLKMIHMTLPEIDNRIRARNTKAGVYRALKEGHYPYGQTPKGFKKDRSSSKTPLLVHSEEAELVKEAFELFATNAFAIEDVRKASWKTGLRLQRTQFGLMLRNPIYMGKIFVPETKDEPSQLVEGIHKGIVFQDTFYRVQKILNSRAERNSHISTKEKLREEFPLRGLLLCPKCKKNWTGSISRGNGGKYAYYHCDNRCKARANASEANDAFRDFLKGLQSPPEVVELYLAMMKKLFEAKEGCREEQIQKLQNLIHGHNANLLKFDQQRFVEESLEADSYKRLKSHTLSEIATNEQTIQELTASDTAFEKYCTFGMNILANLDHYFDKASLEIKKKLLGSVFPLKLTFEDGKYRTDALNSALALILQKNKDLKKERPENSIISEKVSGDVPKAGLEPALRERKQILNLPRLPFRHFGIIRSTTIIQECFFRKENPIAQYFT